MSRTNSLVIDSATEITPQHSLLKTAANADCAAAVPRVALKQYKPVKRDENNERVELHQPTYFRKVIEVLRLNNEPTVSRSTVTIDLFIAIVCFLLVQAIYAGGASFTSHDANGFSSSLLLLVLILSASGIYNPKRERSLNQELTMLTICWIGAFVTIGLYSFLTDTAADSSRNLLATSMLLSLASLYSVRMLGALQFRVGSKRQTKNVIICGNRSRIDPVIHSVENSGNSGIRVAMVFEVQEPQPWNAGSANELGDVAQQMTEYVESQRQSGSAIEEVWIAVTTNQSQAADDISQYFLDSSVNVCVVSDQFTDQLLTGDVTRLSGTKIVNISDVSLSSSAEKFKRAFDVLAASVALLLLCLPMLVIACLIKLETSGPALFRQKRYGIDGTEIDVLKFRSMWVHSDPHVRQATRNDARITRLGKILRSTSLDELPQLINVLSGTMSLIGPRPHAVAHNEMWRKQIKGYMLRHKVRPGITGLAQVNGWRGETDTPFKMEQRVKCDLEYIRKWSPWLDIKILLLTIVKGFRNENAF